MVMEWMSRLYGIADLPEITKDLAQIISHFRVVTFTGNLGAGKTTFLKSKIFNFYLYYHLQF